jgi:hypothetical protein
MDCDYHVFIIKIFGSKGTITCRKPLFHIRFVAAKDIQIVRIKDEMVRPIDTEEKWPNP